MKLASCFFSAATIFLGTSGGFGGGGVSAFGGSTGGAAGGGATGIGGLLKITCATRSTSSSLSESFGDNTETIKLKRTEKMRAAKIPVNSDDDKINGESKGTNCRVKKNL